MSTGRVVHGACSHVWALRALLLVSAPACARTGPTNVDDHDAIVEELRSAHDDIWLRLRRADTEVYSPYSGTAVLRVRLDYGECLREHCAKHPEVRQDGDYGDDLFGTMSTGWYDSCAGRSDITCEVVNVAQDLSARAFLEVVYENHSNLEGRTVSFGPIPRVIEDDCMPAMEVVDPGMIVGEDAHGRVLWRAVNTVPRVLEADFWQAFPELEVVAAREPE